MRSRTIASVGFHRRWPPLRAARRPRAMALLMSADERYEGDRQQCLGPDWPVGELLDQHQLLHEEGGANGNDHAPARLELLKQGWRNLRRRCGDDDAVEWRRLRPSIIAVAVADMNSVVTEVGQPSCRLLGQARYNLDRINLIPQLSQHSGLIARASADFERASARREPQQVGHQGDDVRL